MAKLPRRVEQCTTHYVGCACHEWRADEMAKALRIIRTWAACDRRSMESRDEAMANIVDKCDEALGTQQD